VRAEEQRAHGQETEVQVLHLSGLNGAPAGGKARGLGALIEAGLRVPPGFVIVGARPTTGFGDELSRAYDELGRGRVAVRSSALGEDGGVASFAGQYETVLDVEGPDHVLRAVLRCIESTDSDRATSYRERRTTQRDVSMNVIVQRMIAPRAAGVAFTADPVTGRRDCLIVDAVEGTGDALVSGRETPDHYRLSRTGARLGADLRGAEPILDDVALRALAADAIKAERALGVPLDLEWAIDGDGTIHWLQARPITALPRDPDELGLLQEPEDCVTRCNIGECMPGAVTPLAWSTVWKADDFSLQIMQQRIGLQKEPLAGYRFTRLYFGRLFLNLQKMGRTSTHIIGASDESIGLAICGRVVPELRTGPKAPMLVRAVNSVRYVRYLASGAKHEAQLEALAARFDIAELDEATAQYEAIDAALPAMYEAFDHHMTSSAGSGAMEPAILQTLAKGGEVTAEHHARVAALLRSSSAHDVESADIVAGVDRIVAALARQPELARRLDEGTPEEALEALRGDDGEAGRSFADYLRRHGHRCVRELELREREWADDPLPIVASIKARLAALRAGGGRRPTEPPADPGELGRGLRWMVTTTQNAVRRRERTKSLLVLVLQRFKKAYRRLGELLAASGALPDADAVFFLTHEELGRLARGARAVGEEAFADVAVGRRKIMAYQNDVIFTDVITGFPEPQPIRGAPAVVAGEQGVLQGKPVSRGRVEGVARVAHTVAEAAALEPGEILIAPITDVGWSPYFGLIGGLATDVGSSVSHGAVVAREYGLPAVVDLRNATAVFKSGDRVILDGDLGTLSLTKTNQQGGDDALAV
jgi:pyruvate,water dikinase